MAIEFGKKTISDIQVFEYTDTLSLPVEAGSHIGDVVKVGDVYGVQLTERGRTPDEEAAVVAAVEAAGGVYVPGAKGTQGLNKPGFASVRVRGGAYKLAVTGLSGDRTDIGKVVGVSSVAGGVATLEVGEGTKAIGFISNTIDGEHAVVVLN